MTRSLALYACGSNASGQLGIGHLDDSHTLTTCGLHSSLNDVLAGHHVDVIDLCGASTHSLLLLRLHDPNSPIGQSQNLLLGAGTNTLGQLGPRCKLWGDTRPELAYKPLDLLGSLGLGHEEWEPVKVATTWTTSFVVYQRIHLATIADDDSASGQANASSPRSDNDTEPTQIVVACGSNDFGEAGIPPSSHQVGRVAVTTPSDMPSIVELGLKPGEVVEHIRGGQRHVVCVVRDASGRQRVVGWGANRKGELDPLGHSTSGRVVSGPAQNRGKGKAAVRSTTLTPTILPVRLGPGETVEDVALGSGHTILLLSSGRVIGWGSDVKGQIAGLEEEAREVVQIAATWGGTYLLDSKLKLWSQGNNSHSQLLRSTTDPQGSRGEVIVPLTLQVEQGVLSLRTGSEHVLLRVSREQGEADEVWAGGWNEHGNLGLGDTPDRPTLEKVPLPEGVRRVRGIWGGLAATWIWAEC